ncbi:hypothetical protein V493_06636 [Pseudogymnoascus sp. VKM F-4281 (FW-2241)]|nr:hypothetical protein V493_06636 [Pseudogymnoascus sp. VKM F-4281 (FW-2241)]
MRVETVRVVIHDSQMPGYHDHDRPRQTGNSHASREAEAQVEILPRTGKQDREPRKSQPLRPNQFSSSRHRSKNYPSHFRRVRGPKPTVGASSMASTEDEADTSNTSMSEGQQQPRPDDGILERNKLSLTDQFRSRYHVDDNPNTPGLPPQPTTSRPISTQGIYPPNDLTPGLEFRSNCETDRQEYSANAGSLQKAEGQLETYGEVLTFSIDSGATTPHTLYFAAREYQDMPSFPGPELPEPIKPGETSDSILQKSSTVSGGPLYPASNTARINNSASTVRDIVDEAMPTSNGIPVAKLTSHEDFEIISIADSNPTDDDCDKSLDLDWLCTQDRNERGYMILIPFSLSSVEPPKVVTVPSKAEVQKVAQLRLNVRRRRHEIQNLKLFLQTKENQIFDENEEAFRRLRESVTERHRKPQIHDSNLELASRLFFASRLSRDECGPLYVEISSLEERLSLEEANLTHAEDSLYESFGIPPMESGEGQGNDTTVRGPPISHSPPTEDEHTSTPHIDVPQGKDETSVDDAHSIGSSAEYRKKYHPLYIEYQENLGIQDNLYERRAYIRQDQDMFEEQRESRHRIGLTLLQDDQDYLDSIPEEIRKLDVEIDEYRLEIEQLRAQCLQQGIIDEDDCYIDDDYEPSNGSDESMPPHPPPPFPPLPPSVPPRPPVSILPPQITITPNPTSSLPDTAPSFITSNLGARLDDQDYQNRINPWLLGKLAASRTELALLATILSAMNAEPDVASLLDVFSLWDRDGAGMEPPQRPENLDEATLNRLRRVTREVVGDGFDRALVKSLFGLSLWDKEAYVGDQENDVTAYLDDN